MNLREALDTAEGSALIDPNALAGASPALGVYAALRKRDGKTHAEAVVIIREIDPNSDIDADISRFDAMTAAASTAKTW